MYIDLLVKIKNAQQAGKKSFKTRFSKMDEGVLEVLKNHGFIKKSEIKGKSYKRVIEIDCDVSHPIQGVAFLSKPSLRRYGGYKDLKRVKGNYGILVISTSQGIMSGFEAKKKKLGGQLLFEIW